MSVSLGLTELTQGSLRSIRDKLLSGSLKAPLSESALQAAGLGHTWSAVSQFKDLDTQAWTSILDVVLAERRRPDKTQLDLVWTGPEASSSTARDTWVVMRELFLIAKKRVLVAGFRVDAGKDLFEPLHTRMRERAMPVQIFLDIPRPPLGRSPSDHAARFVQDFVSSNWPFGAPYPEFYYDPRTIQPEAVASLHAKCVAVDGEAVLIGSANFTERGQTRNIEMGVQIRDTSFAQEVMSQWQGLINNCLVERCRY